MSLVRLGLPLPLVRELGPHATQELGAGADCASGIFVAFGGLLFGYDTGTISGIIAMPYWLKVGYLLNEPFSYSQNSADHLV